MSEILKHVKEAEEKGVAVGHFNISNIEMMWGIFNVARKYEVPVVIGVSEGERDFIGVEQCVALIRSLREKYDYPVFLNADHTYSFERVKEVIDAGFDSAIIDGAQLSFEENVEVTRKCVEYAREAGGHTVIEAEIGYIGKSSQLFDELPEGAAVTEEMITTPEEARKFVEETGVDMLAPAVGTVHGMMRKGFNPKLHIDAIRRIREAAGVPLVLHGGSGSSDGDVRDAVEAGIGMIHVSTEIRVAFRKAIEKAFEEDGEVVAPYKYMKGAVEEVGRVVEEKLKVFNNTL